MRIEEWTRTLNKHEVMRNCQQAGIASGAVLNIREVMTDEHLIYRNAFETVRHPEPPEGVGKRLHIGTPWKLSSTPASTNFHSREDIGADNDYVYKKLLGMSDEEMAELEAAGVISRAPTGESRSILVRPRQFEKSDENFLEILGLK